MILFSYYILLFYFYLDKNYKSYLDKKNKIILNLDNNINIDNKIITKNYSLNINININNDTFN